MTDPASKMPETNVSDTVSTQSFTSSAATHVNEHKQHDENKPGFFNRMGRRLSEMSKMGLGDESHKGKLPEAQLLHNKDGQGKKQWVSHIGDDIGRPVHHDAQDL